jgi:Ca2+-binding EF-hand superfamily protein
MDGNGKIDSYELICALAMLSHSTLEEKAELIFNLYDFDGSKYISEDELVILLTNSLTAINNMQKKPPPTI